MIRQENRGYLPEKDVRNKNKQRTRENIWRPIFNADKTSVKLVHAVKCNVFRGFQGALLSESLPIVRNCGSYVAVFLHEKVFSRWFHLLLLSRCSTCCWFYCVHWKHFDYKTKARKLLSFCRSRVSSILAAIIAATRLKIQFLLYRRKLPTQWIIVG